MTARSRLADACPSCFPGDYAAVLPSSVTADVNGSLRAGYVHGACGTQWTAWWDAGAAGWPRASPDPAPRPLPAVARPELSR